jgi:transcriptional regulator with XRE-family HTH domain
MQRERKAIAGYVKELLTRSRMPRNQVAAISGLSNAYIRVLERGETASVRREKLISFAVALSMDLYETDALLASFDRTELTLDDIPTFIETSRQMKISSALLPLRDVFMIELLFLAIEQVPGRQIIVNDRPTSCLRPEGFRGYSCRGMADVHPIHSALIESIGRERKQNLICCLKQHPVDNYIFMDSLEEYIRRCEDTEELKWRVKHIEATLQQIRNYPLFKLFLTRTVPSFLFSLKLPEDSENESPKLAFIGNQIDFFMGKGSGRLAGFATDNQVVIENFQADLDLLKKSVIEEYLDQQRLEAYLESLVSR